MSKQKNGLDVKENRSDPRTVIQGFYSVEFQVGGVGPIYQFKLRDESAHGLSILVKQDSSIVELLKVNEIVEMRYFRDRAEGMKRIKTKIVHITKQEVGKFAGHFLIGLSMLP